MTDNNLYYSDEDTDIDSNISNLYERHRIVVDKGQGLMRIDKYLTNLLGGVSRTRFQNAADFGFITVNGNTVKSSYRVKPLDEIVISLETPPGDYTIVAQDIPLTVVFEDNDIMVVNKPPDMVVHPGVGNLDGTLLNAIAWHLKDNPMFDVNNPRLGLVHRIDKDTSGLILIAKNEYAKSFLGKQFQDKTTQRTYNALAWGTIKDDIGTINGALARNPKDRMQFCVFSEDENPMAKHAVTHYRVLKRFKYTTLVECNLETGRTHQIRVHLKHIGHTLFNDERYGGNEILFGERTSKYKQFVNNCFEVCPRQALHAKTLGFVHPTTCEEMFFDSQLPEDFQNLINKWENYSTR
ncbi:pseudouridine synthase [Porphyromonadaceae bacterium COT-184 OH4590]|nr:pseudouridine synthase [Porphyromonadaceae bacterium COT-184 OH4590]